MTGKYNIGDKVYISVSNLDFRGTGVIADIATDYGPGMYLVVDIEEIETSSGSNTTWQVMAMREKRAAVIAEKWLFDFVEELNPSCDLSDLFKEVCNGTA